MKYVKVQETSGPWPGYSLDADDYLAVLPTIQDRLPDGARRFALDEHHYNFFGPRCVKDLKLSEVRIFDSNGEMGVELMFAPNMFKHDQGLTVRYVDVTGFSVDVQAPRKEVDVRPDSRRLGDLQLDEILPHESGVSHEVRMTGGVIRVVAADLHAQWQNPPDAPDEDEISQSSGS